MNPDLKLIEQICLFLLKTFLFALISEVTEKTEGIDTRAIMQWL